MRDSENAAGMLISIVTTTVAALTSAELMKKFWKFSEAKRLQ
jgi:hypothetical protein